MPVCWTRRDGGWAAEVWELWTLVRDYDEARGWQVNWSAFGQLVPARVRDDDEARMELAHGLAICASVVNNPKDSLFPDTPESD